jgi:hypothetical protein
MINLHSKNYNHMIYGITLILIGILASPNILLNKKPNAKELLDKILPYQGILGSIYFFWGAWNIVKAIFNIEYIGSWSTWWLTWFGASLIQTLLGFLLGYEVINKYILSKNDKLDQKGYEILQKLRPLENKLALIAIGLGIWIIIYNLFNF